MLPNWLTVFLAILIEAWSVRRDAQIRFLKLQVELLRQKVPGQRVILPEDRDRLLRTGEAMDHRVNDVIVIVAVKTYRRWAREKAAGRQAGREERCEWVLDILEHRRKWIAPEPRVTVDLESFLYMIIS